MRDLPAIGWSDELRGRVIKITEHWIVMVLPMIYNDRVVISNHEEWHRGWTAGWCYDKGGAAALAAELFDPETQREPVGFKKLAGDARNGAML